MRCSRVAAAALLALVIGSPPDLFPAPPSDEARPRVLVAEYDGIIHPIAAEFLDEAITRADTSGASAMVIVLRTPGGLLDSTRTIVSRMIAAHTPIVVFVGPSGARAASAGFLIALAADVAVMAPGTHIGAAHPVAAAARESPSNETMMKKAASDAAAYARTLAEARGRNAKLAAAAVTDSRAFTEREALSASPPLIDFTAPDVAQILRQLDGRAIKRFDGRGVTIRSGNAAIERVAMTRRQQFLSAIAHPQIAYLLLTLGMLGLTVELWNPGSILPGVVGGVCLLLAFFAFQVLPIDTTGLLLIVFGIALLILEIKVTSFGILGVGGTLSLLMGSVMLTNEIPGVRVSYTLIGSVVISLAAIVLFLGQLALQSHRRRAVTGSEGLVGERGVTLGPIEFGETGHVRVHGEIWRARSNRALASGVEVSVTAVEGLTLLVEPQEPVDRPHERNLEGERT